MIYDICVIGAGASGMTASIAAAENHAKVLLLERFDIPGKKILATGNGRCNLSNTSIVKGEIPAGTYRSTCRSFPYKVLEAFDVNETYRFFGRLGLYTHHRDSYIYPLSDQAQSVADVLRRKIKSLSDITMITNAEIRGVGIKRSPGKKLFEIISEDGTKYISKKVILACGSRSGAAGDPKGAGYQIAKNLGLRVISQVPALCALHCREAYFKTLAGVRVQGKITIFRGDEMLAFDEGEIQLTSYGISGIPAFQVSRFAAYGLKNHEKITAVLDLMPAFSSERLSRLIKKQCELYPYRSLVHILEGFMNRKLAAFIAGKAGERITGEMLESVDCKTLANRIKHLRSEIVSVSPYKESQVSAGGVDTGVIYPETMEAIHIPGLYVTGELLDVDGICGGFNLQWAWATGYIAGKAAARQK